MNQDCGRQPIIAFGIILAVSSPLQYYFHLMSRWVEQDLHYSKSHFARHARRVGHGGRRYKRNILSDCFGDRVRGREREMEYVMPRRRRATPLSGKEGGGEGGDSVLLRR